MLKILMDGMCSGCGYADLELDCLDFPDGRKIWTVKCVHRNACDNMEAKTIKRIENDKIDPIVIRCKDCAEYSEWLNGKICLRYGSYYGNTKPNDYCSYAIRKEGPDGKTD